MEERKDEFVGLSAETHTELAAMANEALEDGYVIEHVLPVRGRVWALFRYSQYHREDSVTEGYWGIEEGLLGSSCNDPQNLDPEFVNRYRRKVLEAFRKWRQARIGEHNPFITEKTS